MSEARHRLLSHANSLGAALLLAVATLLFTSVPSARAGEITVIDGIPHVRNEKPPGRQVTMTPREMWRRGGDDDDIFFGNIARIDHDDAGNFYILDRQQCEVTVLTAEGEFVRTLGRRGEGPGELYRPADFYLRRGGGVGMMQQFPGKVVLVDGEGVPAGGFTVSSGDGPATGFMALVDSRSRGDHVVIAGIDMAFEGGVTKQTYFLSAVDDAGVRQVTYLSKQNTINFADFVGSEETMDFIWWGQRWALAPGGHVVANMDRNQYRIQEFDASGELLRVVERAYESWERSDDELSEARQVLRAAVSGYPAPPTSLEIEETDPDISAIYARDDGSFWVRTSRGDRPEGGGVLTVLDAFDVDGHLTHEIAVRMQGNVGVDALYVCGDRILQVTNALGAFVAGHGGRADVDETEEEEKEKLEVVCYEVGGSR